MKLSDLNEIPAQWVSIDTLKPWADNPRNHKDNIDQLCELITRFGWTTPIVARKENGELIEGHGRLLAAKKLGLELVPVRLVSLSEEEAHLAAIASNRVAEQSAWDDADLFKVLEVYSKEDQILAGFDIGELDELLKSFQPNDPSELGKLDEIKPIICPQCGHAFNRV